MSLVLGQSSITDGLVAYFPMDGDLRDLSGNCHTAVNYGARATQDRNGVFLGAMEFDGIKDYIEIGHSDLFDFSIDANFTISFWLKIAQQQVDLDTLDNDILSKWVIDDSSSKHLEDGYPFAVRVLNQRMGKTENKIYASQFGGYKTDCEDGTGLHSKNILSSSGFQHVVFTARKSRLYLYMDGNLQMRKGSNVFCSPENRAPLRIGKRGGLEHQNHFKGAIDELLIYDRSLSEVEIKSLSNRTYDLSDQLNITTFEKSLVGVDTLFFDENTFELNNAQKGKLSSVTDKLLSSSKYYAEIEGHTNGIPKDDFCDELSLKRAKVVENHLLSLGINCLKLKAIGKGKRNLLASDKTKEGRKRNQRAEVKLYKLILP